MNQNTDLEPPAFISNAIRKREAALGPGKSFDDMAPSQLAVALRGTIAALSVQCLWAARGEAA